MDIVQISNVFNALTQLNPFFQFYHCGLASKINQNGIPNNFDLTNSTGKNYPAIFFPYDATRHTQDLYNQRQLAKMEMTLLFYDSMFYGNDSKNNTRTEPEIYRDLKANADGFLVALRKANGQEIAGNPCNGLGIDQNAPLTVDPVPFAHNDRLMCLRYDFTLTYFAECTAFDPDFSLLPAEFPLPVEDWDYEDPNFKNDSP